MKLKRKCVQFSKAEIYYFNRCIGMDKVPQRGNNPLGMEDKHMEYEEKIISKCVEKNEFSFQCHGKNINDMNKFERNTEFSNSKNHRNSTIERRFSNDSIDSQMSVKSIDYTVNSLQPLTPIQRKTCLLDAGVLFKNEKDTQEIEKCKEESKLLIKLRQGRQMVGCQCRVNGMSQCNPAKCNCSREGIPCQSDGNHFPCKCGPRCKNPNGRRAYSYDRISFHYQHTLVRMNDDYDDINDENMVTSDGDCIKCVEFAEKNPRKSLSSRSPSLKISTRKRAANSNVKSNDPTASKSSNSLPNAKPTYNGSRSAPISTPEKSPATNGDRTPTQLPDSISFKTPQSPIVNIISTNLLNSSPIKRSPNTNIKQTTSPVNFVTSTPKLNKLNEINNSQRISLNFVASPIPRDSTGMNFGGKSLVDYSISPSQSHGSSICSTSSPNYFKKHDVKYNSSFINTSHNTKNKNNENTPPLTVQFLKLQSNQHKWPLLKEISLAPEVVDLTSSPTKFNDPVPIIPYKSSAIVGDNRKRKIHRTQPSASFDTISSRSFSFSNTTIIDLTNDEDDVNSNSNNTESSSAAIITQTDNFPKTDSPRSNNKDSCDNI